MMRTVCGSEFQRVDAENRKAHLEKSVLVNGWTRSRMAVEHKVQLLWMTQCGVMSAKIGWSNRRLKWYSRELI